MGIAPLEEVLTYKNEAVLLRFLETWDIPRADADDLFDQMNKWLWLSALAEVTEGAPQLAILPSTKLLDEMWHTFVLFSKDYVAYCERYFGHYLHHVPTPQDEYEIALASYERDPEKHMQLLHDTFERQYEFIYDHLGEETLIKWYSEYTDRYTDEYMRQVWRWSFSPYDTRVRESLRVASVPEPAMAAGAGNA